MSEKRTFTEASDAVGMSGCVFMALCCQTTTISCDDCMKGCIADGEFLCITKEFCCITDVEPLPIGLDPKETHLCNLACFCCSIGCKVPSTCIKQKGQFCCLMQQCAFPCDANIPAACAVYGIMCFPKICGCCVDIKDILPAPETAPINQN